MLVRELETAIELARHAGTHILKYFRGDFEVVEKAVTSYYSEPVTIADRESSRMIVEALAVSFPGDAILSEEEVDDVERRLASKRVWIIDPLDGTKGFVEGIDDFAVQIALVDEGRPVVGVVYQPVGDVLYSAKTDSGAFVKTQNSDDLRLAVSKVISFPDMTIAVSRSHRSIRMNDLIEHFGFENEIRHGSVGLKVGILARKEADIYIHLSPHTKFWDSAAPQIILEESGGKLTDIFGGRINYLSADVKNHNGILATNGAAHKETVDHLLPLLTDFGRVRIKAR